MQRMRIVLGVSVLVFGLAQAAWAGGGASKEPKGQPPEASPEQAAIEAYNMGIASRDKAWKLEEKLAAATDEKERAKLGNKIEKTYRGAAASFETAIAKNPAMHEAHSDLGYALRKLGDFEASLAAYDRALELEPRYAQAIEYRAEAYLGLGRIDEAKQAYMTLFEGQSDQAPALLEAMQAWVAERRSDPGDVAPDRVEAFAAWVAERAELAGNAKSVSQLKDADW